MSEIHQNTQEMAEIHQNTQQWIELRKTKIGASDAPIIMGDSPWKTPFKLWEEKMGFSEPDQNFAMKRGSELEPVALELYNDLTGCMAEPKVVFHEKYDWLMASLDGLCFLGELAVEIKCPGKADHEMAKNGKVPKKYYAQLQHQMMVLEAKHIDYFSYINSEDHVLLHIDRDDNYIEKMFKKEKQFYKNMVDFVPPEASESDYINRWDKDWEEASSQFKQAKEALERAKELEKTARENLITLADGKNCLGAGIRCQKIIRKGAVDYKKIDVLADVDLDQYRKESSVSWKIS